MRADVKGRRKANEVKQKVIAAEAKKLLDQLSPIQRAEEERKRAEEKTAQKNAEKAAAAERKNLVEKQKLDRCGNVMTSLNVGLKTVTIYEKGYIEIGGMFSGGIPSKLLGISSNLNTKKKNIVGRGMGSLVSGGANLLFTSGNKGMALLTIVTVDGSQVIKVDSPKDSDIKAIVELEGVGQAAIELASALETSSIPAASKNTSISVVDELAKLAELKKSGALTASEYTAAKKKLLS
jgi:hypothetical protein